MAITSANMSEKSSTKRRLADESFKGGSMTPIISSRLMRISLWTLHTMETSHGKKTAITQPYPLCDR